MKPIEYYYEGREQTYLKHLFLEAYLETLGYHIGFYQREFVYVDCFAGPWRNADEELGDTSIRISLDRLNAVKIGLAKANRHPKIRAIFVERDKSTFATLEDALQRYRGSLKASAMLGTFEENIPAILNAIRSTFSFFFIDPTGWTGFAMDNSRPILARPRGEVMINLMFNDINRFLEFRNAANEASLDRLFGTPDWRKIPQSENREDALIELYKEQVRKSSGLPCFVTSTRILKPTHDRAYFHLVYSTRSPTGLVKFREVEWKVVRRQDQVRDEAKRRSRESRAGQSEFNFVSEHLSEALASERDSQLEKARTRLFNLIQSGPLAYENLQPLVLELRLVRRTDLDGILMAEHEGGRLVIDGLGPRDRTPKLGHAIRLAKRQ
jgi:three-Cys-motif partner protein